MVDCSTSMSDHRMFLAMGDVTPPTHTERVAVNRAPFMRSNSRRAVAIPSAHLLLRE